MLSEFLGFIVRETLEKRGHVLKEYTIGVHALGKDADFNPQLDSIVRIHAGRLRRALKEYYYEDGVQDPIVIAIPKGSYMPSFENRSAESHDPEIKKVEAERKETTSVLEVTMPVAPLKNDNRKKLADHKPAIAVLPCRKIGQGSILDQFSQSIGEFLCTELTRFENLKVISYYSSGHVITTGAPIERDRHPARGGLHSHVVPLEEAGDHLRVFVQFNGCETGEQLWGRTFEKPDNNVSYWEFQNNIIEMILAAITGINGVIARNEIKKSITAPGTLDTTSLAFWYNKYSHSPDRKTLTRGQTLLSAGIERRYPTTRSRWHTSVASSILKYVCRDILLKMGITVSLMRTTALRLDPHCQHAYQAMAFNMLIQRKSEECVRTLEEGLSLNPKSAEYRGAMGAFLIYSGNFERGIEMLDQVIKLMPSATLVANHGIQLLRILPRKL